MRKRYFAVRCKCFRKLRYVCKVLTYKWLRSHNYKSTVPGCEGQEQSSIELASCAPLGTTFADATTTITGLVIPYVRAIQMRHAYNQGAEATSTPITDTPSLSSSQPSALSSPTAISDGKQDTSFSPNHGLSSRARIAIGVTVPLVVLSITTLIVFWFFFRAKRRSAVVTEPIESANGNDCDLPEVAFHNDTSRGLATVEGTSPYTELESPQNAVVFSSHAELGMPDPASNRSELPVGERLVSPQHAPKPEMAELSENLVSSELDASAMVSRPLSSAELEVAASQSVLQPSQVEVNQPRSSHNVSACDSALPEVVPVTAALEILSDEELKARRVKVARDREKLERMVELDRLREEEERIVEETTRRTGYI